jgi:hypothetical protein
MPPIPDRTIFHDIAEAALTFGCELRACVAPLIADQPSIREFALALGLDKSIAWKVHHIATAADATLILVTLPGPAGLANVMRAITATGKDTRALEAARAALVKVIRSHGLSRTQIKSMAIRQFGDSAERGATRLIHKRAHESNAAIHGVSIHGTAVAIMLLPGGTSGCVTLVEGTLLHRFMHTLNAGPVPIHYWTRRHRSGMQAESRKGSPTYGHAAASLVRELCSAEVRDAHLRTVDLGGGHALCYEPPPAAANHVDFAFREIGHGAFALPLVPHRGAADTAVSLFIPMQHLLVDLMIHSSMPVSDVQQDMYLNHAPESMQSSSPEFLRYPIKMDARWIANPALPAPFAAAAERWKALVEGCAKAVQTPISKFTTYRIQVRYPPTPSRIRVRWTWPGR